MNTKPDNSQASVGIGSTASLGSVKTMEEQACEYAEALSDIAETLCIDWENAADIVSAVRKLDRDHRQLRCASRENLISARIIKAENDQRGHIYAIDRDAKFIIARTQAVLPNAQSEPRAQPEKL